MRVRCRLGTLGLLRRRWQHDRVVRSTHGVNCTGCVQSSTRYPGGVALRFARVKRYRPDKGAAETDSIDDLRTLLSRG